MFSHNFGSILTQVLSCSYAEFPKKFKNIYRICIADIENKIDT